MRNQGYVTIGVDWMGRWFKEWFDIYSGALGQTNRLLNPMTVLKLRKNKAFDFGIRLTKKIIGHGLNQPSFDKANVVTDYALEMLKSHKDENLFLFIHYWDTHMPYSPPREYLAQFENNSYHPEVEKIQDVLKQVRNEERRLFLKDYMRKMKSTQEVLARYDASLHFVDTEIGRLVTKIKELGLSQDTLLIITTDHGESLTEHGIFFDHPGLYDELLHVPLIMCYPRMIRPGVIETTIQHLDLMPIILDLADIKYEEKYFDGKSLVPVLVARDRTQWHPFVYVEEARYQRKFALRTEKYKYIFAPSEAEAICSHCGRIHGGVEELYDLESDPCEAHNISSEKPEVSNELRRTLIEFREGLQRKRGKHHLTEKIRKLKTSGKI